MRSVAEKSVSPSESPAVHQPQGEWQGISQSLPSAAPGVVLSWLPAAPDAPPGDSRAEAKKQMEMGDSLGRSGRREQALRCYREAARLDPGNSACHRKLALAAWELRQPKLAERHLQEAVRLAPNDAKLHDSLAQLYNDSGNRPQALLYSAQALALAPNDPQIVITRAWVLQNSKQLEASWQLIRPLIAAGVPSEHLALLYARMAPKLRQEREALSFILGLLQSGKLPPPSNSSLHMAAATLLDGIGEYDAAFEHAVRGKEMSRRPYDHHAMTYWIKSQISYFAPEKLGSLRRASHGSRRPIFIVGMPRSGTSLVEQILASHPQVYGAGELPKLMEIADSVPQRDWARGTPYPAWLDLMDVGRANELANAYLSFLSSLNSTARYVTDKMPGNWNVVGLIAALFPGGHVIHCTRDPRDTCLSCFMTDFATGQNFTHALDDLGAYYCDHLRLMNHFKFALHCPIIEVNYESLVGDLRGQTRSLLQSLELPWDEQCLRFHENPRNVTTGSQDQVDRPIYASSTGRWKNYEKHLDELTDQLRRGGALEADPQATGRVC